MATHPSYKLPKKERLRSKIRVANLFTQGNAFISFPFRVVFLETNDDTQVLFSVSKKHFKSAVKRNKLKRRMREAYRLHKSLLHTFLNEKQRSLEIGFTYITDDELPYKKIEKAMIESFQKLQKEIG